MEKEDNEKKFEINETIKKIIEKLGIDLENLKAEQIKLRKELILKDEINFDQIKTIGGCDSAFFDNQIISAIMVMNTDMEVLEKKFFIEKVKFPYLPGFLAYRKMPSLLHCYHKLENVPDLLIVGANGALHPRMFGMASHFGLSIGKPVIGVTKKLLLGKVKKDKIYINSKVVGQCLKTKEGSNPIYISPGHKITLESAVKIIKKCLRLPHKLPEPLYLAHRYATKIREEFGKKTKEKEE